MGHVSRPIRQPTSIVDFAALREEDLSRVAFGLVHDGVVVACFDTHRVSMNAFLEQVQVECVEMTIAKAGEVRGPRATEHSRAE